MLLGQKIFNDSIYNRKYLYKNENGEELVDNRSDIQFIEFSKLKKLDIEKASTLEKVCYYMQYAHLENKHDIMEMIKDEVEVVRMLEKGKEKYMESLSERLQEVREYYDRAAYEEEKRNARKAGLRKGLREGRKEGKKEGRAESKKEIAIEMLKENTPLDFISKVTKLSLEEIKKLIH